MYQYIRDYLEPPGLPDDFQVRWTFEGTQGATVVSMNHYGVTEFLVNQVTPGLDNLEQQLFDLMLQPYDDEQTFKMRMEYWHGAVDAACMLFSLDPQAMKSRLKARYRKTKGEASNARTLDGKAVSQTDSSRSAPAS